MEKNIIARRFELKKVLGEGGMGRVLLAYDILRREEVAVKLIKSSAILDAVAMDSFRNEYDLLSRLRHPGLVQVFDFGRDAETDDFYIVEEFLPGRTLRDMLTEDGLFSADLAIEIIVKLLRTLEFIHSRKIIYRDLKPENIIVSHDQKIVKLLDFGLADPQSKIEKKIKGTIRYLAPEVLNGLADERSDIFAIGVILYEMLTGSLLYIDSTVSSVVSVLSSQHNYKALQQISLDKIKDSNLKQVISRLTEYETTKRVADCSQAISLLNKFTSRNYEIETSETAKAYLQYPIFVDLGYLAKISSIIAPDNSFCLQINGSAGCGKSRLLQELEKNGKLTGQPFIAISCYGSNALQCIKDLIGELLFLISKEIIADFGHQLKKICPEHPVLAEYQVAPVLDAENEKNQIVAMVSSFFCAAVNNNHKLIFAIDQTENLDEMSKEILLETLDLAEDSSIELKLLLFNRTEVLNDDFWLKIGTLKNAQTVRISPLNNQDISSYFDAVFDNRKVHHSLSEHLQDFLAKTGGSVLYLRELLGYLVNNNFLCRAADKGWFLKQNLSDLELPDSIFDLAYDKLFNRLSPEQIRLLLQIYLVTTPLSFKELNFIFPELNGSQNLIFELVDQELLKIRVIENQNYIEPANTTYRKILLDQANASDVAKMHLYLAEKLADYYATNKLTPNYEQLAHHAFLSRELQIDKARLLLYLQQATKINQQKFANKQAILYCQQLLRVLGEVQDDKNTCKLKTETIIRLAGLYRLIGRNQDAFVAINDELAKPDLDISAQIDLETALAELLYLMGDYQDALDHSTRSLIRAKEQKSDLQIVKLIHNLGNCLAETGEFTQAKEYYQQAIKLCKEIGNDQLEAEIYGALGVVYYDLADYSKAITCQKTKLKILQQTDNLQEMSSTYNNIGVVYHDKGKLDQAHSYYQKSYDSAKSNGDLRAMSIAIGNLGLIFDEQNNFEKAIDFYKKSLNLAESCGHKKGVAINAGNIGMIYFDLGDFEKSIKYSKKYYRISESINNRQGLAIAAESLAQAYFETGDIKQAELEINQAILLGEELSIKYYLAGFYLMKAKIELLNENNQAEAFLLRAIESAASVEQPEILFKAQLMLKNWQYGKQIISQAEFLAYLDEKITSSTENEELAELYFYRFIINRQISDKQKSQVLYKGLYKKVPKYIYKQKIKELELLVT